jgi:hypothetical protein
VILPLAQVEMRAIQHALACEKGNKTRAAQLLGISRQTLRTKLKEHALADDGTKPSRIQWRARPSLRWCAAAAGDPGWRSARSRPAVTKRTSGSSCICPAGDPLVADPARRQ